MLSVALLSTLLSLPLSLAPGSVQLDADDLGQGFGASAAQLVSAVSELEELGLPVRLELTLLHADGTAASDASILAAWRDQRSLLHADPEGRVLLSLDGGRLDTLQLALPQGLRAEIEIPWIDELGYDADCRNSDALLIAAGC
jgi:hypothetical protein